MEELLHKILAQLEVISRTFQVREVMFVPQQAVTPPNGGDTNLPGGKTTILSSEVSVVGTNALVFSNRSNVTVRIKGIELDPSGTLQFSADSHYLVISDSFNIDFIPSEVQLSDPNFLVTGHVDWAKMDDRRLGGNYVQQNP